MWVTDRLPDAGLDQTSPFDNLITSYASSSSIDVENHGGSETSSWYSPLPFVGASAISSPTDRISIMLPSHPIAIPSASPTGSAVYYVNPWTQQYESLSPPSPQKEGQGGLDQQSSPGRSEPGKPSERRRAQNRAAQRTFKARKQQRERDLLGRIGELEQTVNGLQKERQRLIGVLEGLRREQSTP